MSNSTSKKRAFRIGAGVAALVGLTLTGAGAAQAATGFDPGAADSRVGGADRYATAALIAQQSWTTASTVIVANGETNGIDALSASYLAGVVDAPILLTQRDSVPAETAAAIAKLNPAKVIVVGGEPSVSASTYAALTTGRAAERIAGADRYETAAKIVDAGMAATTTTQAITTVKSVFIARGDLYGTNVAADALAASPVAFRGHVPVLLTASDELPATTLTRLQALKPTSLFAIGDTKAVSSAVESQLRTATGLASVGRLQGSDRTETAAAIANSQLAADAGFTKTAVGIANGYKVDALAAGPAAGKGGYPLLLTESATSLGSGTAAYLNANKATLTSAKVFGDASSVSSTATDSARSAAEGTVTTPPATGGGGGGSSPVVVSAEIQPIHVGDMSFTVKFSGPVQSSSVEATDFFINRNLMSSPGIGLLAYDYEFEEPVYDAASNEATVKLAHGYQFRSGQQVGIRAQSVLSSSGGESPAVDNMQPVTKYVVTAAVADVLSDPVVLTLGAVPDSVEVKVTEFRGNDDQGDVLDAQGRSVELSGGAVSFVRPTEAGVYTYAVTYVNSGVDASDRTPVAGAVTVQPAPIPGSSIQQDGANSAITLTTLQALSADQDLIVQRRAENTENWMTVGAVPGETATEFALELPEELGTYEYQVAVVERGAVSDFAPVGGSARVTIAAPESVVASADQQAEELRVTLGSAPVNGENVLVQYRLVNSQEWSVAQVAELLDSDTLEYKVALPQAPGQYDVRAAFRDETDTSGYRVAANSVTVVPAAFASVTAADDLANGKLNVSVPDALSDGQSVLVQYRSTSEAAWSEAAVGEIVSGTDGLTYSVPRPVVPGNYYVQAAVSQNGVTSNYKEVAERTAVAPAAVESVTGADDVEGGNMVLTLPVSLEPGQDLIVESRADSGDTWGEGVVAGLVADSEGLQYTVPRPASPGDYEVQVAVRENDVLSTYTPTTDNVLVTPPAVASVTPTLLVGGPVRFALPTDLSDHQVLVVQSSADGGTNWSSTTEATGSLGSWSVPLPAAGTYTYRVAVKENDVTSGWTTSEEEIHVLSALTSGSATVVDSKVHVSASTLEAGQTLTVLVSKDEGDWTEFPVTYDDQAEVWVGDLPEDAGTYAFRGIVVDGEGGSSASRDLGDFPLGD